jgi:3-oxoacyl-[acyl-carrier-protein] synthase-3
MSNPNFGVGISGLGFYVPPRVMTNQEFVDLGLDTSDEWIVSRTGIRQRHVAGPDVMTSELGIHAARQALAQSGISATDLSMIIVATSTPDYPYFPSVACLIQQALGATHAGAFDVSAACSGFNYAMTVATQFVQTGSAQHVMVVAADCLSKTVDWSDRSLCVLFGDGAGAAVVSRVQPGFGILYSKLYSNGEHAGILCGSPQTKWIEMNGRAVFKVAVDAIVPAVMEALSSCGLQVSDIQWFIPHQANARIIEHVAEKIGFSSDAVVVNIDRYGNTSAASIPIALSEWNAHSRFKPGDLILTIGFGAGFTWAVQVIKWGGNQ